MPLGAFKAALMGTAGVSTEGDVVLLSTQTASGADEIDFSSGIDSTYGEYIFKFYNINPATDDTNFTFQVNATDGADYNDSAITSTFFTSTRDEAGNVATTPAIQAGLDQAQGTAFQNLTDAQGNGADESSAGVLHIFNPSSTTYVKHFIGKMVAYLENDGVQVSYSAGYINDATAIDDVRFKMSSGAFDGKIKMWGVK
jgi:hypothetical protein